jgi:hypothetical protein
VGQSFMHFLILIFIIILSGFIQTSDVQNKEIKELLCNSIRSNTTKSYDLHIKEWNTFISHEGYMNTDFIHFNDEEILTILLLYTVHLFKLNRIVNTYFSALRNLFITERLVKESSLMVFSSSTLSKAKKGAAISRTDIINQGRSLPSVKPISQSELNNLKRNFWYVNFNCKDILFNVYRERIKYLGIMIGINFGLRASELCISSNCTKHLALTNNNVIFSNFKLNLQVLAVDLFKYKNLKFDRVCLKWLDSKAGLTRTEFLSAVHVVEDELIGHLVEFCIDTKLEAKPLDIFLSVFIDRREITLTRYMMSETIKRVCENNNLGTIGFSSKSLRVSANTFLKLENDIMFRSRESLRGMFAAKSTSSKFYTRNTDVLSGGLCLIKENEFIINSEVIRRNFHN